MYKDSVQVWFHRAVATALIPLMTGCTAALWTPALANQAVHPHIAGLVRNYPKAGDEALVVTYGAPGDGTDVNLVVPLEEDRTPRFPFGLKGQPQSVRLSGAHDDVELAALVEPKQLAAVLASGAKIPGDRELLKKHFNAADWAPVGGKQISWPDWSANHQGTACLLAFETDAAGQVVPVAIDSAQQPDDKIVLSPNVHLLMVPVSVDRPPGDQARDQVAAVALTPAAVAGDAAGAGAAVGAVGALVVVAVPVVVVVAIVDPDALKSPPSSQPESQPVTPPPTATVPIYFHDVKSEPNIAMNERPKANVIGAGR
jgi:hypothetical protein